MTTLARLFRAFSQPIYCLGEGHGVAGHYNIQSATSPHVVYDTYVDVDSGSLSCSCPDFQTRGSICKHLCFVVLRYLRLPADSPATIALGLSQRDIERARDRYVARPMAAAAVVVQLQPAVVKRLDYEGLDCGICCDEMLPAQEIVFCQHGCGQNAHGECMQRWLHSHDTCVYCRAAWWL